MSAILYVTRTHFVCVWCEYMSMYFHAWMHMCGQTCVDTWNVCRTFMSSSVHLHFTYWGKVSCRTWNSPILLQLSRHLSLESLPLESQALSSVIDSGDWKPGPRAPDAPLYPQRWPPALADTLSSVFFLTHALPSLFMGVSLILCNQCEPLFQFL